MVISKWHNFVDTKDINILDNILSKDIVFYSPAMFSPKIGVNNAKIYLTTAIKILFNNNCKYISQINGKYMASCEFEGYIEGVYVNGVDIIHWNKANKITSFKVFIRPLKGLLYLKDKMLSELSKYSISKSRNLKII